MNAGMFVGALFVGIHMATTHGVTLAMMSSYIPTTQVPGIGKISGTAWSLTDFIFGGRSLFSHAPTVFLTSSKELNSRVDASVSV